MLHYQDSMAQLNEFIVIDPPTSGEVREKAFEALKARDALALTIVGIQEVPKPVQEPIQEELFFNIQHTSQLKDGGMRLMGRSAIKGIVTVTTRSDDSLPASGDIIK